MWFYGDGGGQRPNVIKISVDGGETYQDITADSGNYIGAVFNISPYVKEVSAFTILCEAANRSLFTSKVLDKIELVITKDEQVQPRLPHIPRILGLLLPAVIIFTYAARIHFTKAELSTAFLVILIIVLASYLRWNELLRVAGTVLEGDVAGYQRYAQKMNLFSGTGFYSAQFSQREPLYILLVKMFLLFFGNSDTHVRFVSFVFSLVTIVLTYKVAQAWFNSIVGISAALILSIHPYLITLSASGFREEWFTTLLLLFIYYGYVADTIGNRWRILSTGLLIGCMLLTRSESLLMIFIIMILTPLFAKHKWNYRMIVITLLVGISLLVPHLYSIYRTQGTPLHTVNTYTRFYVNQEFMGKPGFPTREDIVRRGMYTGKTVTPLEYYFLLHTPWEFIKYNVLGFAKIYLRMPFAFFSGRGNLERTRFELSELTNNFSLRTIKEFFSYSRAVLTANIRASMMGTSIYVAFFLGLFMIGRQCHWMLYVYLLFFQINTAFIAYVGISERLTVHTYPLVAFCCGYTFYWLYQQFMEKTAYR